MAKQVFRQNEIKNKSGEVTLKLIRNFAPIEEEVEDFQPEYTGPTVEELKKEAEAFKTGWEIEKQHMLEEAQKSADEIVKKAEEAAFAEVKRQTDQVQVIRTDAEREADEIIKNAKLKADEIIAEANAKALSIQDESKSNGYKTGYDDGYAAGENEVHRLIDRMHKIVESVMSRRLEILQDTEQQIVELVILMTRKVVKVITENQKTVVLSNVLAALKKLRTRGKVTIRVNLEDLKLTSERTQDFIKRIENVQDITVLEDSSVDNGGCIVETDFGSIDARISSQLSELENKIMEVSPIKNVRKEN